MSSRSITNQQLDLLVAYMEEHSLFARKQITKLGLCGVDKYRSMLQDLADLLNPLGPPKKTPSDWEKAWDAMRLEAHEEMRKYLDANRQTGEHNIQAPSEWIQRVCYIFGHFGVGFSLTPEFGIYNESNVLCEESKEESLFYQLYDERLLAAQNEVCKNYLSNASEGEANKRSGDMSRYDPLGRSSGSTQQEMNKKLTSEQLKHTAFFLQGIEMNGVMTDRHWVGLAKKPLFAELGWSGEDLRSSWELEVDRVLNKVNRISSGSSKTKLTATETVVFQAVVKDSILHETASPSDDNWLVDDEGNLDDLYTEDDTEPSGSPACAPPVPATQKTMDTSSIYAKKIAAALKFGAQIAGSTNNRPIPSTSSANPSTSTVEDNCSTPMKRNSAATGGDGQPKQKKLKLSGLQVQKQGIEAILEGNEIISCIVDLLNEMKNSRGTTVEVLTSLISDIIANILREGFDILATNIRLLGDRLTATMVNIYERHLLLQARVQEHEFDEPINDEGLFDDGFGNNSPPNSGDEQEE